MMDCELRTIIDAAVAEISLDEDEVIDPTDGLIHCRSCGERRLSVLPPMLGRDYRFPRCVCACQRQSEKQQQEQQVQQQLAQRIQRKRLLGLQDCYLRDYTFEHDNGDNPLLSKARAYAAHWEAAFKKGAGLLLFGSVGTGKSFFAGCIANALIDKDVPVLMTNFPKLLNQLAGMYPEDKAEYIAGLDAFDLLVIDDLGVERNTEYSMEQMFQIVDGRYRSRKPLIVTTNLPLAKLKEPYDLPHARIYDRILERCAPVFFDGKCFREKGAEQNKETVKALVAWNENDSKNAGFGIKT